MREERIGGQRLILGDCREVLAGLGKEDAVVTDPPYGIGYAHGKEKSRFATQFAEVRIVGDDQPFDPGSFLNQPALFWGANHFASRLPGGGAGSSGTSVTASGSTTSPTLNLRGSVASAAPTG